MLPTQRYSPVTITPITALIDQYYVISHPLSSKPDTTFRLNSTTGELVVNGPLDADTKSTYELVVVAEDKGHHRLSDSVVIRVKVSSGIGVKVG